MIRMEYPKANIEGLTDREKIYALKKQLDTLTNNVQLVLESIDGDIEGINEYIGGVPDELDNSMSTISERVDEVETAVGTLEERDYIVEQGTSGIWTYRKWNSGISECWGTSTRTNVSVQRWGSTALYYGTITADSWPSNLFLYAPNAIMFARVTGGNGWLTQNTNVTASSTGTRYIIAPSSDTLATVNVIVHAIGRWK